MFIWFVWLAIPVSRRQRIIVPHGFLHARSNPTWLKPSKPSTITEEVLEPACLQLRCTHVERERSFHASLMQNRFPCYDENRVVPM